MKGTEFFKNEIQKYLDNRAASDSLFAERLQNPEKNIDECIDYILGEVQKSGCNGFADEEIYSMAVHYYDEDKLQVNPPANCRVVINHDLTDEEKAMAKAEAIAQFRDEELAKLRKNSTKKKTETAKEEQPSLF